MRMSGEVECGRKSCWCWLLEIVFWTPRSPLHTAFIVTLIGSVLWFGLRGRSGEELDFAGLCVGDGSDARGWMRRVTGDPAGGGGERACVPANPDWPKLNNLGRM